MTISIRLLPVVFALSALLGFAGCGDPEPGEVSMRITNGGQSTSCTVQVFNAGGKQIQEEAADQYGVVYVKNLAPGKYTFKFKGHDGNYYPAEATADVIAGGSAFLEIELTKAGVVGGDAPAS